MPLHINELDLYLGKKLKSFRTKLHLSLNTLSAKLGISIQQLQRYETGVNKISASLLYAMAHEFKTDVVCFYEGHEGAHRHDISTHNVLLIEENKNDEILFRQAVMEFQEKINVFSCNNGQEAIDFFRSLEDPLYITSPKPDLIFLDLILPVIDGLSVLRDIQRRHALHNIPVVIFTRNFSQEDIQMSYDLHAGGFINKSFSYEDVKGQIHQTLSYWMNTVVLPSQPSMGA